LTLLDLAKAEVSSVPRVEERLPVCDAVVVADKETLVDRTEEFSVKGDDLLRRIKELIAEGNVRRITIKNSDGKTLIEIPLTIGVVGALIVPTAAAIGAIAALVTECTISITRDVEPERSEPMGDDG
jgi:Domain of unknown function (DUF4342)